MPSDTTTMTSYVNDLGQPIGFPLPDWRPPPSPPRATMEGMYCRLESLSPVRDAADLFTALSTDTTGRLWTYLSYGPFDTLASFRHWMDGTCCGDDPLFFTIIRRKDEKPLGVASYLRISPASGSIEVGHLAFAPALQRSKTATEAMYLMMKTAFDLGYRRYEWKCDALNSASRAAAERLGFSFEGIFRQATVYKNRNRDTAWYAAIDAEWPGLRDAFQTWLDPSNFDENDNQRLRLSDLTRPLREKRATLIGP
jgi:RimJ/RimL family protein N-acetyltransferase